MQSQKAVVVEFLAGAPRPAAAGATLWLPPNRLQPAGGLLGLPDIFIAGAPEEQPAADAADGDGDAQLLGDAQEVGFHAPRSDLRAQMDADRLA